MKISNSEIKLFIDKVETSFDKLGNIKVSSNEIEAKFIYSDSVIKLNNSDLKFNTNSLSKLLNSDINLKSTILINNESYETESEYISNINQLNIIKFVGDNFYINEKSFIKYDTKLKISKVILNINSKESFLKALKLNRESKVFSIIDGFKGWQSILVRSSLILIRKVYQ